MTLAQRFIAGESDDSFQSVKRTAELKQSVILSFNRPLHGLRSLHTTFSQHWSAGLLPVVR